MLIFTQIISPIAQAVVFINEAFTNPPGSTDMDREFIELMGTPGMKLDGYAIAVLNGTQSKFYPLGSIPPIPVPAPEIDEFFSLDGLTLGNNGLLALLVRNPDSEYFTNILSDSHWVLRSGLWNGGLDVPGSIKDDGSTTIVLLRNRPGRTQADPNNPDGLRWGKAILHDAQLKTPVWDPNDGNDKDQWGDGDLDEGEPNGLGGNTLDMYGTSTPSDANDDLEIVDEVSYENDNGWEYDTDDRHVDEGSTNEFLPHRHVHALDDPGGFTPNAISRVDYRTKGIGWTPAPNATGEMANGNNWQDTATEQWIRGNVVYKTIMFVKHYYYENTNNPYPSLQPYMTNVPLWLDDDIGQDYDFSTAYTYEIAEGRINHLAVPFIPGDCDRDGLCDANDIAKIKAVFGDDDWIFANSCPDACETDFGDPAIQTRPWDVDATGDNGIEASDLQWTLNFQGDATGQIVGIKYTSNTPAATGVYIDSNAGVQCTVTTDVNIPSGRSLDTLPVGDIVEITVRGQVTAGPNTTSGRENGIMQFVHDVVISTAGVMKVTSIEALGSFSKTRASLEYPLGTDGDLGVQLINGYATSFTQGLSAPAALYKITLQAVGQGNADVTIESATDSMFAASTPHGLKVGHTNSNGNPNSSVYPAPISVTVVPAGDLSGDGLVNWLDVRIMSQNWLQSGPAVQGDINKDNKVNLRDFARLAQDW